MRKPPNPAPVLLQLSQNHFVFLLHRWPTCDDSGTAQAAHPLGGDMSIEVPPVGFSVLELAVSRDFESFLNALVSLILAGHGFSLLGAEGR